VYKQEAADEHEEDADSEGNQEELEVTEEVLHASVCDSEDAD
jgi:hypothetical protein